MVAYCSIVCEAYPRASDHNKHKDEVMDEGSASACCHGPKGFQLHMRPCYSSSIGQHSLSM